MPRWAQDQGLKSCGRACSGNCEVRSEFGHPGGGAQLRRGEDGPWADELGHFANRLCRQALVGSGPMWSNWLGGLLQLYMWTGQSLGHIANHIMLDTIVLWATQLWLPWLAGGDWQNEPGHVASSPWSKALPSSVLAWKGEGGTCRGSSGTEHVISYRWGQPQLLSCLDAVHIDPWRVCRPHRLFSCTLAKPWKSFVVKVPRTPRQWPLEKPIGRARPPSSFLGA